MNSKKMSSIPSLEEMRANLPTQNTVGAPSKDKKV